MPVLLSPTAVALVEPSAGDGPDDNSVRCLVATTSSRVTFFVDSGAGQCLRSVSDAFSDLQPCCIEVTGVSGCLPIYGFGTANFVASDHQGNQLILRIPNCLFGWCEFNLLSVSQLNQVRGNRLDFGLDSPAMVLMPSPGTHRLPARIPLVLEDVLFTLHLEPLGEEDSRFETLRKYTITLKGNLCPAIREGTCGGKQNARNGFFICSFVGRDIGGLSRALAHFLRPVFGTSLDSTSSVPL